LTYLAESVHEDIPVEELAPILKHLIDQFVGEHCVEDKIVLF
jgi:protein SDA1